MKKAILVFSAVLTTVMMLTSSCGVWGHKTIESSNEVTIGKQVWMSKNLNVDKFLNGDPIPEAKSAEEWEKAGENKQPAWCYINNDPTSGENYGKLYNWYAVKDSRGLAPKGYHIPSNTEWTTLMDYLGGEDIAGKKMKSTEGWLNDCKGTNESGFKGLPGFRTGDGTFDGVNTSYFWSSDFVGISEYNGMSYETAWVILLNCEDWCAKVENATDRGLFVRCLKD